MQNDEINIDLGKYIPQTKRIAALIFPIFFIVIMAMSTIYTIPTDSAGVIMRFGKFIKEVDPGIHMKLPFGMDSVIIVPVKRQLKLEFGFSTEGRTDPVQASRSSQWPLETTIVTGDLNIALVEWVVQYRIEKPFAFLFKVRRPGETLRDVSESVMREVVGDRTVDEVLTVGRQEIESKGLARMQEVANMYEMGLRIDQVQLKNVNPPKPVQASFDEVNEAQQERKRMINVALGQYNKIIPRAEGEADQKQETARGYAMERINRASGDIERFNALLTEYVKAPEVTRRRIYLEIMEEIFPRIKSKVIIDKEVEQVLPLLQLNEIKGGQR